MSIIITRPFTSNAVVHVTLGNVLKAIIAFKGLMMERVVVMSFNEQLDLWTESRYKVFQRVTDHAHAAMLHYNNPNLPDMSVKNFLVSLLKIILLYSYSIYELQLKSSDFKIKYFQIIFSKLITDKF